MLPQNWFLQKKLVITSNLKSVLVLDKVAKVAVNILKTAGFDVHESDGGLNTDALVSLAEQVAADAIILRSGTKITKEFFEKYKKISVIARAGVGVDNIDVSTAKKYGVLVINSPDGNTISAVEQTCALIMTLARHTDKTLVNKCSEWKDVKKSITTQWKISELYGKCIAILGLGRVGSKVGQRMHAFGMTVIGYDPLWPMDEKNLPEWLNSLKSLDEICKHADYITLHMPLISSTANLINEKFLNKCKTGVKIINCARGGIINEEALLNAINKGKCSGAALDVLEKEPPEESSASAKLINSPKVLITPHLGASSIEAQDRVAIDVANALCILSGHEEIQKSVSTKRLTGLEGGVNINQDAKDYISLIKTDWDYTLMLSYFLPKFTWHLATILAEKASASNHCTVYLVYSEYYDPEKLSNILNLCLQKAVKVGLANLDASDGENISRYLVKNNQNTETVTDEALKINIKVIANKNYDAVKSVMPFVTSEVEFSRHFENDGALLVYLKLHSDGPELSILGQITKTQKSRILARDGVYLREPIDL